MQYQIEVKTPNGEWKAWRFNSGNQMVFSCAKDAQEMANALFPQVSGKQVRVINVPEYLSRKDLLEIVFTTLEVLYPNGEGFSKSKMAYRIKELYSVYCEQKLQNSEVCFAIDWYLENTFNPDTEKAWEEFASSFDYCPELDKNVLVAEV